MDEIISRITRVSSSAVSKRLKTRKVKQGLSLLESDRIYRFARIVALAADVFADKKESLKWLNSPQYGLGGGVPFGLREFTAYSL